MDNTLLAENRSLGFVGVDITAPDWVKTYIVEHRSAIIGKRPMSAEYLKSFAVGCERRSAVAATFAGAVRSVAKSLEQIFFERTGREARHDKWPTRRTPVRPTETLEQRMARITCEIQAERGSQFSGLMSADEKYWWERQFAALTGLEIKTNF